MVHVTELNDFLTMDYTQIFPGSGPIDRLFSFFANPWVPIVSVGLYLVFSDVVFETIRTTFDIKPKGMGMQLVTIAHSSALAVYSLWTFINAYHICKEMITERGLYATLCDANFDLWDGRNYGFWVTHFYISKFYEFIDTWIILLKGKKPMLLQTFHHAGIALISWGFVVTKNTGAGVILVCFNSFIHSLMYTYYVFAALGVNSVLKRYLTQAQLLQFIVGGGILVPQYWMAGCLSPAQAATTGAIHVYLVILTGLFLQFYIKSYTRKTK